MWGDYNYIVIYGFIMSCKKWNNLYVLLWRTVYALTRVLCIHCRFASIGRILRHKSRLRHNNMITWYWQSFRCNTCAFLSYLSVGFAVVSRPSFRTKYRNMLVDDIGPGFGNSWGTENLKKNMTRKNGSDSRPYEEIYFLWSLASFFRKCWPCVTPVHLETLAVIYWNLCAGIKCQSENYLTYLSYT